MILTVLVRQFRPKTVAIMSPVFSA